MQPSVELSYLTRKVKNHLYAYTRLPDGRTKGLGRADDPKSRSRFLAVQTELNGGIEIPFPTPDPQGLTVAELAVAYLAHEQDRCGAELITRTTFLECQAVVDALVNQHAHLLVTQFGPKSLKAIQQRLAKTPCRNRAGRFKRKTSPPPLCRNQVNSRVNHIRRIFKWGVSEELVPPTILEALRCVTGLRRGEAHDNPPRTAVDPKHVWIVIDHLRSSPPASARNPAYRRAAADALEFILSTGCRPGEACQLRWRDVTLVPDPVVELTEHKTRKATGKNRLIPLNEDANRLIQRLHQTRDSRDPDQPVFDADVKGRTLLPNSLYQLVRKTCAATDCPHWSPYQIRHTVASTVVARTGSEVEASALLGHTPGSTVVQRYSKDRLASARRGAESLTGRPAEDPLKTAEKS